MDTLDVLRQARVLISDKRRWTRHAFARNQFNLKTEARAADAVCWCAVGAIAKVAPAAERDLDPYLAVLDPDDIINVADFNDYREHAEVLALFDKAIQRLESAAAP